MPDGEAAIAVYEKALGAELKHKMTMPGSKKVMHACLQIGSSKIFLANEMPNMPGPKQRHSSSIFMSQTWMPPISARLPGA